MMILFTLLTVVISGYAYLTDSDRVRLMAQGYLSNLVGGRVVIGRATLSIFEGLRLDNVAVYVDRDRTRPDALLFSAQSFVLKYDPRKLVQGQLEATQIIAQKPHVYLTLTHGPDEDRWNFTRLQRRPQPNPAPQAESTAQMTLALPEVLLRNAQVQISEVRGGRVQNVGTMAIDGQLVPWPGERYQFEMQTRGRSEKLGPDANGIVSVNSGQLTAHMHNLEFGADIRAMFPADLRNWWERHEIAGGIQSVDVSYWPPRRTMPARFSVATTLQGVTLAVHRDEWSSRDELDQWKRVQGALSMIALPYRMAGFATGAAPASGALSPVQVVRQIADTSPLLLRDVSGTFIFTDSGIDISQLHVAVGAGDPKDPRRSNAFVVQGHLGDYRPDAPLHLEIASADPKGLYFPAHPRFVESLPADVRQFYQDLQPEGFCRVHALVDRVTAGAMPQISAALDVRSAKFLFHEFPYPFRQATGRIEFGRDPTDGLSYVKVINMRGRGIVGGPNENAIVGVSGRVGPIGPDLPEPGFNLRAFGTNITSEPPLMAAMPSDVKDALKIFDAPGKGKFPQFKGNFVCNVVRPAGPRQRFTFDTDIDLKDASGRISGFAYPCDHVHGKVLVRDGYVVIEDATIPAGPGIAHVKGIVRFADGNGHEQPLDLRLTIDAHDVPIDKSLIGAVPPESSQWLKRLGVAGKADVNGRIFTVVPPDWRDRLRPGQRIHDPPVQFDLGIDVRDGTIWPADGLFSISSVAGKLHLTSDELDVVELSGQRENATISASGKFILAGEHPRMRLHVLAKELAMDHPLYAMLPPDGRSAWDEVQPHGTVDAEVDFSGPLGSSAPPAVASTAQQVAIPQTQPSDFNVVLHPRKLSVKVKTAPYAMTFEQGSVLISSGKATLKDLVATHGKGKLLIQGTGSMAGDARWDLTLHAQDLSIDEQLRAAMPDVMLTVLDSLKLGGTLGFDFNHLIYQAHSGSASPDIDIAGKVTLGGGTMDVGMPLSEIQGGLEFSAASRKGQLDQFNGSLAFDSLKLGGRELRDLKLRLLRPSGHSELHVDQIQAKVAGGELAGGVLMTFPDEGPNRYNMNLVLRNADVRELTGDKDQSVSGELTASLAIEGAWGQTSARRGRGDVVVAGKQLYRMPLMLGLLQVTDLSLPIGSPFTKGIARYTVEGNRVNFEQMELRAQNMVMSGSGYLDFGTRQVRMTLTTDNPGGFKVPFLADLWQGARQELLKINIRGTVQAPKVEPTSLATVTTTIDEVFKGDAGKK